MPDFLLLRDLVIVLSIGFVGAFIARRLKMPLLAGYLVGGFLFTILVGSHFTFDASIDTLSQIGVSLLLFTLGVEFSLTFLTQVKKVAIIGGILQILLTIIATLFVLPHFGFSFGQSLFLGSVFALSSTAVVVKILAEKGELDTIHGEILVGILLLQDLAVIPLMIILPHFLGNGGFQVESILGLFIAILKAGFVIAFTFFFGRTVVPKLLQKIARQNSRELLLLSVVLLALGFAYGANFLGLPPSIGAFLAGLLVSETIVNHAVFSEIRPLRDVFSIIFFVLLGILLSPAFFFTHLPTILSLFIFVVVIKSIIVFFLMLGFSYHTKTSFLVAGSLTSIGEFAFVLAGLFVTQGLISSDLYNLILCTSLLTLLLTPWQISLAPKTYRLFKKLIKKSPYLFKLIFSKHDFDSAFTTELPFENHVVILGHGRVGKVVSKVLSTANIPFVGVDFNLNVVEELKKKGTPFVYGDPTDIEVLDFAQVDKAKVVVIAVPDRHSQEIIIKNALALNKQVKIICRSHSNVDKEHLLASGAHVVVQPEQEAGYAIAQKIVNFFAKE